MNAEQVRLSLRPQKVMALLERASFASGVDLYLKLTEYPQAGEKYTNIDAWFKQLCGKQTRPGEARLLFIKNVIIESTELLRSLQGTVIKLQLFLKPFKLR